MQRLDIKSLPRKPKYHYYGGHTHNIYINYLDRNFNANYPLEKIVTDITLLMNRGQKYYLSLFFDLFNNSIISWDFGTAQNNHIVLNPAKKMLSSIINDDLPRIIHSDQGVQYTSLGYCQLLKNHGIIQSMSRAGNPRDNAVAESLIGHFKDVLYYDFNFRNAINPRNTINIAVDYFNFYRPAYALNYKTPAQFTLEQGFAFFLSTNC